MKNDLGQHTQGSIDSLISSIRNRLDKCLRDTGFTRSSSDYGMFSRRSPPTSGGLTGMSRSRMYEDFSRDSFDDRRPGLRGPSPSRRYAPY